jgi:hypothetical protein
MRMLISQWLSCKVLHVQCDASMYVILQYRDYEFGSGTNLVSWLASRCVCVR